MRKAVDFNHIPTRQDAINLRLEDWAQWVQARPQPWKCQPMWRFAQSKARQWHEPEIRREPDPLKAHETERAVAFLPEKHRTAIRWCYVFPWIPVSMVRQSLGVTREGLLDLVVQGRDMVQNRLRERLVDHG